VEGGGEDYLIGKFTTTVHAYTRLQIVSHESFDDLSCITCCHLENKSGVVALVFDRNAFVILSE
jgi:hypothetical protein